jgi:hypothetical protein
MLWIDDRFIVDSINKVNLFMGVIEHTMNMNEQKAC